MTPRGLREAASILAVAAVLSSAGVGGTFALFSAETQHKTSTFAGGWLDAPTGGSATASGNDVALSWTAATHGLSGYEVWGVTNGTTNSCSGVTYAKLSGALPTSPASYIDANRGDGFHAAANGDWFCYEIRSVYAGTGWYRALDFPSPVEVGLVATQAALSHTSAYPNGKFDSGDTVTLTFNQRVTLAGSSFPVCVFKNSNVITIGDENGCASPTTDTYTFVSITGASLNGNNTITGSGTVVASTSPPWTLTFTLGSISKNVNESGTVTVIPSASIKSYATTDQASACTSGAHCQPTAVSDF